MDSINKLREAETKAATIYEERIL
jgi:hypothetical protein